MTCAICQNKLPKSGWLRTDDEFKQPVHRECIQFWNVIRAGDGAAHVNPAEVEPVKH